MCALAEGWVVIGSATDEDEEEQWFLGAAAVSGREHGSFSRHCCCFGDGDGGGMILKFDGSLWPAWFRCFTTCSRRNYHQP